MPHEQVLWVKDFSICLQPFFNSNLMASLTLEKSQKGNSTASHFANITEGLSTLQSGFKVPFKKDHNNASDVCPVTLISAVCYCIHVR